MLHWRKEANVQQMGNKRWYAAIGILGLGLGAWYLSSPPVASAAYVLNCASNDGRRNFCPADTGRGVRLVRQASQSPCIQGRTWGWDRRGIWVDRGCRADFEVRGGGRPPGPGPGPGPGPRPPAIIRCSSDNMRRNFCPADIRGGVRLVRRLSDSPCRRGYTWGTDRQGIWVDRGCRAEFEVR